MLLVIRRQGIHSLITRRQGIYTLVTGKKGIYLKARNLLFCYEKARKLLVTRWKWILSSVTYDKEVNNSLAIILNRISRNLFLKILKFVFYWHSSIKLYSDVGYIPLICNLFPCIVLFHVQELIQKMDNMNI